MAAIGGQSEVGRLRTVLLKHPREAFVDRERVAAQWHDLGFVGAPDLERASAEFDHLISILKRFEIEILSLPRDDETGLDSIYTRDASVVCDRGAILCSMGKPRRRGRKVCPVSARPHNTRM